MRALRPLVAVAVIAHAGVAAAKPKLVVTAPRDAVGDGATAVEVTVRVDPPEAVGAIEELELLASAGTLGAATQAGDDGVSYSFVPPRVAADMPVAFTAVAKHKRSDLRGTATLTVTAPTAQVETRSTGGAYDLQVPERVRLGRDAFVELSIARGAEEPPDVFVNVGTVTGFAAEGDRWRATYTPPRGGAPQLAIVAVVSEDRTAVDWARIPLVGLGRLNLHSEPDASVVVRVGAIEFGPVRTDRKGEAKLAVEAPPGVAQATTLATDELGNVRKGALPLHPPPFSRMLAICPSLGGRTLFLVVDGNTSPARSPELTPTASIGAVADPAVVAPGVVAAAYELSADAAFGDALRIDAGLPDGAGAAGCDTTIPGELPSSVEVSFDAEAFVAGSGKPVRVTARRVYPGKLPPIETPIEAAVDFGELAFEGTSGTWSLPDDLGGRSAATVTVTSASRTQEVQLPLRPGPPLAPALEASRLELTADGKTPVDLVVEVRDAFGNPVRDAALSASARGSVTAFRSGGDGRYYATYVPPLRFEALVDTVRVSVGGVEGSVAIALDASRSRFSVALTGGYLTNFGKVAAPMVAIDAAYRPPVLSQRLAVGIEAWLYASDDERAAAGGGERVQTSVMAVPVLARATYTVPFGGVSAYGGASVGVLLSERGIESPGAGRIVNSGPTLAAAALAGGEVRLGPGRAVLEVSFMYAAIDDEELDGNAGGLRFGAGYRYDL